MMWTCGSGDDDEDGCLPQAVLEPRQGILDSVIDQQILIAQQVGCVEVDDYDDGPGPSEAWWAGPLPLSPAAPQPISSVQLAAVAACRAMRASADVGGPAGALQREW
ncbi:unnamed protein product, partial [Prorocentrum cordatum]